MDETTQTPDVPVTEEVTQPVEQEAPVQTQDEPVQTQPVEAPVETEQEEEFGYPSFQQLPQLPQIDFNNLPVGEDNLIDPNALAGTINQSIAAAEERATMRAERAYEERRAEEKSWEKAFDKYPELKTNRELRDFVQRARMGEIQDALYRSQDGRDVKMPTPSQVADRLFKFANAKKQEGMSQATQNTVVQQSAYVETGRTANSDSSEARSKNWQNINNPNKEIANNARNSLLKSMLFGEE